MKNEFMTFPSFRQEEASVREEFLDAITPGNLRRVCWLIAIYFPISLWFLIENLFVLRVTELVAWSIFDLVLAVVFFCLAFFGNKRPGLWKSKRWIVRLYYSYCLISMTGYYFSVVPRFGDNGAFILGVLMASLIFRLPPREFLPLLLINQGVFITGVLGLGKSSDFTLAAFIFGLDALVLGLLGAWTLFSNDWRNFQQKRALERAIQELHKQAEEQNELMAITAHNLASPLDSLQMLFGLLLEAPAWNREPYRSILESSRQSISPMQALVTRLLDAHAAENPQAVPLLQSIDIQSCIDRALAVVKPAADAKNIRLICAHSLSPAAVTGVPVLNEQVLENLLFNAVKFSLPGTIVEVRGEVHEDYILIDVLDEGPGIRAEDRERLFRKFYKTSNKPTREEPSFGIGLFIVSNLMEMQKGSVTYLPRELQGSIFRLKFESAAQ